MIYNNRVSNNRVSKLIFSFGLCALTIGSPGASENVNFSGNRKSFQPLIANEQSLTLGPQLIDFGELTYRQQNPRVREFQVTNDSSRTLLFVNSVEFQAKSCERASWFQLKTPSSISVPANQTVTVPVVLIPIKFKSNELTQNIQCSGKINIQSQADSGMSLDWQVKLKKS